MIQPLFKDKWLQGILTAAGRREVMRDKSLTSREMLDVGSYLHCLGTSTLSRDIALGNANVGRQNIRAVATIADYFYCESLGFPNSSCVIKVRTDESFHH